MVRPNHSAWLTKGFERVIVEGCKKPQAKCIKCSKIYVNTEKARLEKHKCSGQPNPRFENPSEEIEQISSSEEDPVQVDNVASFQTASTSKSELCQVEHPAKRIKVSSFKARTLTGYDSLTTKEYNELNKVFAKFLIENNIPFEAVNSKSLKAFLKLLRPAYNVPDSYRFSTVILEEIYAESMNKIRKESTSEATLILKKDGEKFVAHVKPMFVKEVFLREIDCQTSPKDAFNMFKDEAMTNFNLVITSLVEDCMTPDEISQLELKNFAVKSHSIHIAKVVEYASEPDLTLQVAELLQAFNISSSPNKDRWIEELDMIQFCVDSWKDLRQATIDDQMIPEHFAKQLYDNDFQAKIKKLALDLNYIKVVAMNSGNLSDIMSAWFNLFQNTSLITDGSRVFDEIFNKLNLAAYIFNPKYKDIQLSSKQKSVTRFFVFKLLQDPIEYEKFDEYLEGSGEFSEKGLLNMNPKSYWTIMKGYSAKLSNLGLLLNSLPATTLGHFQEIVLDVKQQQDPTLTRKIQFIKSFW